MQAVQKFGQHNVHRRGHVDFIYLALRKMREYGVERDLAVYNLLLDVFPKEVFRPRSVLHSIFIHYPRQQECGIAVLEQMENHGEARGPEGVGVGLGAPPCSRGLPPSRCCTALLCLALSLSFSQSLFLSLISLLPLTFPLNSLGFRSPSLSSVP